MIAAQFVPNIPLAQKSFWTHPTVLLRERLKWKLVLVRLEIVLRKISAWFTQNVPLACKSFWTLPMVLLGDEAQVKARFGPFGDSTNLDAR
jgi:hypothetical protein